MKRPDKGSRVGKPISLLVNHFRVKFNPNFTIMHYHMDVVQVASSNKPVKRSIPKSDLLSLREKLSLDHPGRFPLDKTAYDGEKSVFSTVELGTGEIEVQLLDGDRVVPRTYRITIKLVNKLKLSKLKDYLSGSLSDIPRDILQGMDLAMKDNPSRTRISSGRHFYSKEYRHGDDFHNGVAAYRGFQQGLKPTGQGLVLCLDYCVMPFHKPMPVLEFLMEHVRGFKGPNDVLDLKEYVGKSLQGLKVLVTHRRTKQKYTIMGLSEEKTRDITFELEDLDGNNPSRMVFLVDYFREKYGYEIKHQQIPSLDIGKGKRRNYVPMELCEVAVGQRYPKEFLKGDRARLLKTISLPPPMERKKAIIEIVRGQDGPTGVVTENFEIGVAKDMTSVMGRVLVAPQLKLGSQDGRPRRVSVDVAKAHWNLTDKSVSQGKSLDRWALIDFGGRLNTGGFVQKLKNRCDRLGMRVSDPIVSCSANMRALSSVNLLKEFLNGVVKDAGRRSNTKLQMIVCAMAEKHNGYKYLKFLEREIGVVTQCCLSDLANKSNDQYLANLALKINAKLGGSNVELDEGVPCFRKDDHVMFIGADVNHPAARNETCPSIAAVVGTINWPVANQYSARICSQTHRKETILTFGSMCLELVNAYEQCNGVKPLKIVLFRDGVSEGQFDMVLNEELLDMKKTFEEKNYYPMITVVVAQKRHQTRLFLDGDDRGRPLGNVPPGTVVDSTIVHPFEFDFYCCSHYGGLGTSKPTHYYVLWDENQFTSEGLQKLIYNLCFTFARCTKPVSLVPPVYYADLVAYRGRLYQEVVMESQSRTRSSSSVATSSSSLDGSFDSRFYDQHPDLKNIMFFV
ncbi:hypothetical protein Leryth_008345 [Lithospermum erythrorhizon]|nr:hypothetical protein Leryth_008345 [Lithospermum erythrorhizon]